MHVDTNTASKSDGRVVPWNKGKLLGQKPPLKLKEIWAIRIRLQLDHRTRELALFNLAIDSKLRGCDLDRAGLSEAGAVSLSQPRVGLAPSVDATVFPDRWILGKRDWSRPGGV